MNNPATPTFAVVGHPNKGKSSIVATLAHNDSIQISPRSRTTLTAERYEIKTANGQFHLIDTPGFQRPSKVLQWLTEHSQSASDRAQTIKAFVLDADCRRDFPDEVELLLPIVNGAAILYVVDGSRPYSSQYETEMEILRWTGEPSMALINPIKNTEYVTEWEQALHQYFKSVTVFNPMLADYQKQTELLSVFAHLKLAWKDALLAISSALMATEQQRRYDSITILTRLLEDVCSYRVEQKVLTESQAQYLEPTLQQKFYQWILQREARAYQELLALYTHLNTEFSIADLDLPSDLFDCDQWFAWGLSKKQLLVAATVAGAVGGAALDFAVAGHSFMLGALGGGIIGASSAYFGSEKIASTRLKGLPLGGFSAIYGPVSNKNFPYVIIGRFLYCFRYISRLTHADRRALTIAATDFQQAVEQLEKSQQKELHIACAQLIKQKPAPNLHDALIRLLD
ncbi:MAG: GTPase/DUF3482 domain-containing protein [Gammaproteobacteria bacterium]|nr:GTPase/DUF3482 domain-containing protein [Gammaproteobacteria bacterium]